MEIMDMRNKYISILMMLTSFCILFAIFHTFFNVDKKTTHQTYTIQSISYDTESEGLFFLGIGEIKEKTYYVTYKVNEDNGLELFKMNAEHTTIYETLENDEPAYIDVEYNGFGKYNHINLYVPKNTVKQTYEL